MEEQLFRIRDCVLLGTQISFPVRRSNCSLFAESTTRISAQKMYNFTLRYRRLILFAATTHYLFVSSTISLLGFRFRYDFRGRWELEEEIGGKGYQPRQQIVTSIGERSISKHGTLFGSADQQGQQKCKRFRRMPSGCCNAYCCGLRLHVFNAMKR